MRRKNGTKDFVNVGGVGENFVPILNAKEDIFVTLVKLCVG